MEAANAAISFAARVRQRTQVKADKQSRQERIFLHPATHMINKMLSEAEHEKLSVALQRDLSKLKIMYDKVSGRYCRQMGTKKLQNEPGRV